MKMLMRGMFTMVLVAGISGARISQADCEPTVWDLTAGQTEVVGTVTVDNDGENLYITYKIDVAGAVLGELHLWVGADINDVPKNKAGIIVLGHFPYVVDATGLMEYTFEVNWSDWADGGQEIAVVTHAVVLYLDEDGLVVAGDTAFGGDVRGPGRRWWYYGLYTICDEEVPPEELEVWKGETAWAAGLRYQNPGSWATYTPYVADSTVNLWAGQTMLAGAVTFSAPQDGMVTIEIQLNGGWRFDPAATAPVKVQDYDTAPSGNPSLGLFAHKAAVIDGNLAVIVVPENNFYGIHVDVEWLVE